MSEGLDVTALLKEEPKNQFVPENTLTEADLMDELSRADPTLAILVKTIETLSLRLNTLENLYTDLSKYVAYLASKDPTLAKHFVEKESENRNEEQTS